ncbi:MAG: hypothetical protein RIS47_2204 [Bacteroidota bacterium]|jgi:ATP-dependent RNA helicase DeaD
MKLFNETGLNPEILRALDDLGFVEPTPVQAQAIPFLLSSERDLMAFAQTGTGKTAAFSLPIIHKADLSNRDTQAIILCPTRELCLQITKDIERFTKYIPSIEILAVYGGSPIDGQIRQLRKGAHIVVGTPGRVMDLLRRKILQLGTIQWVVLDEADEMLSMGFKEDLDVILAETPQTKQTLLFSATMPRDLITLARKYMDNPEEMATAKRNAGADTVEHQYYMVSASNRYVALKRIVDMTPNIYGIVFCRTRQETKDVADKLMQDGYDADSLHGDLSQAQRDLVMHKFRSNHLQILVATDVAARGLDVTDLSHVINYNLPEDSEVYVHRSGRTGRAGKSGVSVSIIHSRETRRIQDIEKMLGKKFEHKFVPSGKEICQTQLFHLIDKVHTVEINDSEIESFLPTVYEKLESLERDELIKRFLSVEFNRFLAYYQNAEDLNYDAKKAPKARTTENRDYATFHINIGKRTGYTASKLISLINRHLRERDASIGRVDVQNKFSYFEIESSYCDLLEDKFKKVFDDGEQVIIQRSTMPIEVSSGNDDRRGSRRDSGGRSDRNDRRDSGGGYRGNDRRDNGSAPRRNDRRTDSRSDSRPDRRNDSRSDSRTDRRTDSRPDTRSTERRTPERSFNNEATSETKPRTQPLPEKVKPKVNFDEGFSWDDFEKFVQDTPDSGSTEKKKAPRRKNAL